METTQRVRMLVTWGIILCGVLFIALGCEKLYLRMGLSEEETAAQVTKDNVEIVQAIEQSRTIFWQSISGIVAGLGAVLSGVLGGLLNRERKVTAAIIKGVENVESVLVKPAIKKAAVDAGVEKALHNRVVKLT